ncbi:MAG: ORF6N domain-containing protein [Clostridiales bacterium]|nr:ORF6N domain-containing protein [Clostridiales bacterium]
MCIIETIIYYDEESVLDKIYMVRGSKVMLDFELAEIYGYSTKAFNQQVKNNIEKFDEDFRFQLTREELEELVRS